jgi:hypothetical protein
MSYWSCPFSCAIPLHFPKSHESYIPSFPMPFCLSFFDNILIYSKTWKYHLIHVDQGLHILSKHQLFSQIV